MYDIKVRPLSNLVTIISVSIIGSCCYAQEEFQTDMAVE